MKKLSLIFIFFLILVGISNAKVYSCDKISGKPSVGIFTQDCINAILTNYVTYHPNGFFIIIISEEKNVYVQGTRTEGNSFLFEAVCPQYSDTITPTVVKELIKLGWTFGDQGNYNKVIYINEIFNRKAAGLLYKTLDNYDLEKNDIVLSYFMSD